MFRGNASLSVRVHAERVPSAFAPNSTGGTAAVALAFFVLVLLALLPLAAVSPLPLVDHPVQVARVYLAAHLDQAPALRGFFALDWRVGAGTGVELLAPALAVAMPANLAVELYTALAVVVFLSGFVALNFALFGRASPLLLFLLAYNGVLLEGQVDFLLAIGWGAWVWAFWLWGQRQAPTPALPAAAACGFLLSAIIHPLGFSAVGAAFAASEAYKGLLPSERAARPTWSRPFATLVALAPGALYLALAAARRWDEPWLWPTLYGKALSLPGAFVAHDPAIDASILALLAAALALGFVSRRLVVQGGVAAALALTAALWLATPAQAWGFERVDRALALFGLALLLAGLDWRVFRSWHRRFWLACAGAAFALRLALVTVHWINAQPVYDEGLRVMARVPDGAALTAHLVGQGSPGDPPLERFAAFAVPRQHAFAPSVAATNRRGPVTLARGPSGGAEPENSHLLVIDRGGARDAAERGLPEGAEPVSRQGAFSLYALP